MSSGFRRYEILLPVQFNDGTNVPDELVGEVLISLRQRFGATSSETQTIHGQWEQAGQIYFDDLLRVFVDVPDTPESLAFFRSFKLLLKDRFKQLDIWITSHPVDVI
jgi:hypothetical protein